MRSISAAHPQVGWVSPVLLVGRGEGLGVASEVPGMTPNSESEGEGGGGEGEYEGGIGEGTSS